jgi:hypothetical protein
MRARVRSGRKEADRKEHPTSNIQHPEKLEAPNNQSGPALSPACRNASKSNILGRIDAAVLQSANFSIRSGSPLLITEVLDWIFPGGWRLEVGGFAALELSLDISHRRKDCERLVSLTRRFSGVCIRPEGCDCFNSFRAPRETVETVPLCGLAALTPLKRGVNEIGAPEPGNV